jgi:DNA-binding MarR family transcriptional regulator
LFPRLEVETFPGHGIRRLQQVAVAVFSQATEAWGVTPLQFAVLQKLVHLPGIDQRTLSMEVGFDKSTIGGVIDRLEARGLLQRQHGQG